MAKKLLFHGDGNDAEEHIKNCKIKKCKTCSTLKEFLKRIKEEGMDDSIDAWKFAKQSMINGAEIDMKMIKNMPNLCRNTKLNTMEVKKIAKKDLNKLNFEDLKSEVDKLENQKKSATTEVKGFYQLGKPYLIRTVTMIYTGRMVKTSDKELVITEACWIPDTGRWKSACEKGTFDEVEPYPKDAEVIINREAVLDLFKIDFKLPTEQK